MSVSSEPLTAARILIRVEDGAFASRLLERMRSPGVRARVLGVLRWLRLLDAVLADYCSRPLDGLDPEVRAALRLGLFEAAQLGVPPAVATDRAVRLVGRMGRWPATGLVNAVLRRAANQWQEVTAGAEPDLRLSHPTWLYRRWADLLGEDLAVQLMEVDQQPAATWVWFDTEAVRERLVGAGVELVAHPWCPGAWAAPAAARALLAEVEAGRAYAQDPGSQLIAHLAGQLAGVGDRMVDLCAAPGGKTALLLRHRRWRCAAALELRPGRVAMVRALTERVGGGAVVAAADAGRPPLAARAWDLVLLDAPCSGTGVLRRHPELRWRLSEEALPDLVATQARLLEAAWPLVAGSGVLAYVTCSLEPEENERLLENTWPGFATVALGELLPAGTRWVPTRAGGIRLLPSADCDGFTVHALRRV